MPLNRENKQVVVTKVSKKFAEAQIVILAKYRGITAVDLNKLRAQATKQNVYICVLKNTLARRAVQDTAFLCLAKKMVGPLIYIISKDIVSAAKILVNFSRSNENLIIHLGSYNCEILDKTSIQMLANIPNRLELLNKLFYIIQAPLFKCIHVLTELKQKKIT